MIRTLSHYISGKLAPPSSGEFLDKFDPRSGEKIAAIPRGSRADVDMAARAAAAALPEWRDRRPVERGRVLLELARMMRARVATLAEVEGREAGKPAWQAQSEIEGAAQYFEFYGGLVNTNHGETINLGSRYHSYTRREPFGVVGASFRGTRP